MSGKKAKSAAKSAAARKSSGFSAISKINQKARQLRASNKRLDQRAAISKAAALYRSGKL